ncbi:hypothetical protein QFZ41_000501 [Luteibacter sp. W1I16]|uniref:hypothetical protein n=1 Tax=Luteibacter sp. W1I16 TaxID=3373922 RepID=UPI003D1B49B3
MEGADLVLDRLSLFVMRGVPLHDDIARLVLRERGRGQEQEERDMEPGYLPQRTHASVLKKNAAVVHGGEGSLQ